MSSAAVRPADIRRPPIWECGVAALVLVVVSVVYLASYLPGKPSVVPAYALLAGATALVVAQLVLIGSLASFSRGSFHLVACFCVLSAIVSALVSAYPEEALLKALSLGLLFIYAASGGRTAVILFQPWLFFRNLLIGCEILSLLTAILYFVFR